MKMVKVPAKPKSEHILSPWLNISEVAIYCGVSRETLRALIKKKPLPATAGDKSNRRYHVAVVDEWWKDLSGDRNGLC
jgi:excisionase family DNA binding protein